MKKADTQIRQKVAASKTAVGEKRGMKIGFGYSD